MRNLVRDGVEHVLPLVASEVLVPLDVVVVVGDAADVLHGTHCVIGAENGVELVEWVRRVKHLFVVLDGALRDSEPIVLHLLSVIGERFAAIDPHGNSGELLLALFAWVQAVERACHEAEQIGRDTFGASKFVHHDRLISKAGHDWGIERDLESLESRPVILIFGVNGLGATSPDILTVADHLPVGGGDDAGLVRGFQIGLVEARENDVAVIGLQLSVDVLCAVSLILKVLESLAVLHIVRLEVDHDTVDSFVLILGRDVDAVVAPKVLRALWHSGTIDDERLDGLSLVVNEKTFFVVNTVHEVGSNARLGPVNCHLAMEGLTSFHEPEGQRVAHLRDKCASALCLSLREVVICAVVWVGEAFPVGIISDHDLLLFFLFLFGFLCRYNRFFVTSIAILLSFFVDCECCRNDTEKDGSTKG